ncbi:MAG: metalloregulator ArsR/SmtB family transcription factor [Caldilineaceae bacterium]
MSTVPVHHELPNILKVLAHEVRWQLLVELVRSDYQVNELVERVHRPMNLVSYHLKQLRNHQLVTERRSSADGRDIYYSLDLDQLAALYHKSGSQLHPALGQAVPDPQHTPTDVSQPPLRVFFLCTHNSARSQMAEGLLRHLGGSRVEVFSAGNQPATVHPHAIRAMAELGIDISRQRAKHMDEFRGQSFGLVITVCDRVRENCPVFPNDPDRVHWSIPDPLATDADAAYPLFATVAQELRTRVTYLLLALQNRGEKPLHPRQGEGAKRKVLFLCTGNSARSQMAEAFMRTYAGDRYEVHSAGLHPKGMNPYTVRVMEEVGLDLSEQRSKDVSEYLGRTNFAYLFTVCARGEADCPTSFLNNGGERIEWDFADPVAFAGTEEETLAKFRAIRDQIDQQIRAWLAARHELHLG